jgi:putative glutamine amidotransferase
MKPLVLIPGRHSEQAVGHRTAVVSSGRLYADAIERAGGIAIVLPPTVDHDVVADAVLRCDGLVFLGGGDVCPGTYGEQETARLYGLDASLDHFELLVLREAIALNKPILAICRGHQMLNVALGGTLIQHLDTTDDHRDTMHKVDLVHNSHVANAMRTTQPIVHSFHHQAIKEIASELDIVGTHHDGTIEAVQHRTANWIVGVQWHPEDTAHEDPQQQQLFDELVRHAQTTTRLSSAPTL